jgi:hypothetical protein
MRILLSLLLLPPILLAQDRSAADVRLEERRSAEVRPLVLFPRFPLDLQPERPPGFEQVPELSDEGRYASVELGRRTLRLGFDAPPGALALGLLHCGGEEPARGRARVDPQSKALLVDFRDVDATGLRIDVRLRYQGTELRSAFLQPARHRRGRAVLGGIVHEVILVDEDANGRYDDPGDRWIALRADRLKQRSQLRRAEMNLRIHPQIPFFEDGTALMVVKVAADGSSLVLVRDRPEVPAERVLSTRFAEVRDSYFESFKKERLRFADRHRLDLRRPRSPRTVVWPAGTLTAARKIARREGKPLLAWYITESNPWCFRLAYYTFTDREVAELLENFVLVVIDVEKDPERSYAKCGARGLPTLLPLTADGEPIRFKVRHATLQGNVEDLKEPDTLLTGWQRPQELATNLKRILRAAR